MGHEEALAIHQAGAGVEGRHFVVEPLPVSAEAVELRAQGQGRVGLPLSAHAQPLLVCLVAVVQHVVVGAQRAAIDGHVAQVAAVEARHVGTRYHTRLTLDARGSG